MRILDSVGIFLWLKLGLICGTVCLLGWDYHKLAVLFLPDHKINLRLAEETKDEFMNDPVWSVTGL